MTYKMGVYYRPSVHETISDELKRTPEYKAQLRSLSRKYHRSLHQKPIEKAVAWDVQCIFKMKNKTCLYTTDVAANIRFHAIMEAMQYELRGDPEIAAEVFNESLNTAKSLNSEESYVVNVPDDKKRDYVLHGVAKEKVIRKPTRSPDPPEKRVRLEHNEFHDIHLEDTNMEAEHKHDSDSTMSIHDSSSDTMSIHDSSSSRPPSPPPTPPPTPRPPTPPTDHTDHEAESSVEEHRGVIRRRDDRSDDEDEGERLAVIQRLQGEEDDDVLPSPTEIDTAAVAVEPTNTETSPTEAATPGAASPAQPEATPPAQPEAAPPAEPSLHHTLMGFANEIGGHITTQNERLLHHLSQYVTPPNTQSQPPSMQQPQAPDMPPQTPDTSTQAPNTQPQASSPPDESEDIDIDIDHDDDDGSESTNASTPLSVSGGVRMAEYKMLYQTLIDHGYSHEVSHAEALAMIEFDIEDNEQHPTDEPSPPEDPTSQEQPQPPEEQQPQPSEEQPPQPDTTGPSTSTAAPLESPEVPIPPDCGGATTDPFPQDVSDTNNPEMDVQTPSDNAPQVSPNINKPDVSMGVRAKKNPTPEGPDVSPNINKPDVSMGVRATKKPTPEGPDVSPNINKPDVSMGVKPPPPPVQGPTPFPSSLRDSIDPNAPKPTTEDKKAHREFLKEIAKDYARMVKDACIDTVTDITHTHSEKIKNTLRQMKPEQRVLFPSPLRHNERLMVLFRRRPDGQVALDENGHPIIEEVSRITNDESAQLKAHQLLSDLTDLKMTYYPYHGKACRRYFSTSEFSFMGLKCNARTTRLRHSLVLPGLVFNDNLLQIDMGEEDKRQKKPRRPKGLYHRIVTLIRLLGNTLDIAKPKTSPHASKQEQLRELYELETLKESYDRFSRTTDYNYNVKDAESKNLAPIREALEDVVNNTTLAQLMAAMGNSDQGSNMPDMSSGPSATQPPSNPQPSSGTKGDAAPPNAPPNSPADPFNSNPFEPGPIQHEHAFEENKDLQRPSNPVDSRFSTSAFSF